VTKGNSVILDLKCDDRKGVDNADGGGNDKGWL